MSGQAELRLPVGKVDEWYGDTEWMAVREIIDKLKEECFVFNDFDEKEVDDFSMNTMTRSGTRFTAGTIRRC